MCGVHAASHSVVRPSWRCTATVTAVIRRLTARHAVASSRRGTTCDVTCDCTPVNVRTRVTFAALRSLTGALCVNTVCCTAAKNRSSVPSVTNGFATAGHWGYINDFTQVNNDLLLPTERFCCCGPVYLEPTAWQPSWPRAESQHFNWRRTFLRDIDDKTY